MPVPGIPVLAVRSGKTVRVPVSQRRHGALIQPRPSDLAASAIGLGWLHRLAGWLFSPAHLQCIWPIMCKYDVIHKTGST